MAAVGHVEDIMVEWTTTMGEEKPHHWPNTGGRMFLG